MARRIAAVAGLAALAAAAVTIVPAQANPHAPARHLPSEAPGTRYTLTDPTRHLTAHVIRHAYGIPQIVARNYRSLGYGYGYVFAQDNLCTMADDYVTVEGQRSRYFGPNGSYDQRGNGVVVNNRDSDIFWTAIRQSGIVNKLRREKPPLGPLPQLKAGVRGYVAGYNRYLHDVGGAAGITDPACHDAPWVHPITATDAYLRFYQLVLLAGYDVAQPGIAEATPPAPGGSSSPALTHPTRLARRIATAWQRQHDRLGSNAVAVGRQGTRSGHGLLLGNPHFPWLGTERFYQAQLTIPGRLDVAGASLFGVPLILIGYTHNMAWSHTVSTAFRFTPYQLTLDPADPTSYLYDGTAHPMRPQTVTIEVRQPGGGVQPEHHTIWWTRYGPVFTSLEGIPLPWTDATAFAIRDANATNFRVFNHFLATDRAQSAAQELRILKRYEGIPWVNTIVADRSGHALYADIGTIPNVPDSLAHRCDTALGTATFRLIGLPVLDGSTSSCNWLNDRGAAVPGIFGPQHLPHLFRRDYVTNSNDSYWLSNPHHPLTGYARIIGDEGTPRSLRTRVGLVMTAARARRGFTLRSMQHEVFSDLQYAGVLMRNDLVRGCRTAAAGGYLPTSSGTPVAAGDACAVLAHWDLHENLSSHGAVLFRRFVDHLFGSAEGTAYAYGHAAPFWKTQFNVHDPVHTPRGLNTADPVVLTSLGDAVADLRAAHLPLNVAPRRVQYVVKNGKRYPIPGGPGDPNGEFNAIYTAWVDGKGLTRPDDGSSYVQVVTWGDHGCPRVRTILTYSLSTDPTNPHYADQTRRFSHKRWVNPGLCPRAVR